MASARGLRTGAGAGTQGPGQPESTCRPLPRGAPSRWGPSSEGAKAAGSDAPPGGSTPEPSGWQRQTTGLSVRPVGWAGG